MAKNLTVRGRLELSLAQRAIVDSIFAGPIVVLQCLAAYSRPIRTVQDAALFLLLHRARIIPYLAGDRDATLEMLKRLVVHLTDAAPDYLTVSLKHWTISKEGSVTLPSLGLCDLHLDVQSNQNELLELSGPCAASLEHHGKEILFSIAYQKCSKTVRDPGSTKCTHRRKIRAAPPSPVDIDAKRCCICHEPLSPNHWKAHANLLSSIQVESAPRWNPSDVGLGSGGSIWAVSGGLPSLGKR